MRNNLVKKALAVVTGAVVFAGTMVAGVGAPATQVEACDFNSSQVNALKGAFDYSFYANQYPDVKAAYGMNEAALFNHFLNHGITEGRMWNASFDPKAYVQAYSDVANYCNGDYSKAYLHYLNYGQNENRDLTTFALLAALSNGGYNNNYSNWGWYGNGSPTENWLRSMYDGDQWLWAYYDIYHTFPDWINNDDGQWDDRLFYAYVDYYGHLPGQQTYNGWNWNWWNWDWDYDDDDDDNNWNWWNWNNTSWNNNCWNNNSWYNPWFYNTCDCDA